MVNSILITVRTSSTRLPRKAILDINGKPTIQYLIENINVQKKMGASGRELALHKFDFRKINPKIVELYR